MTEPPLVLQRARPADALVSDFLQAQQTMRQVGLLLYLVHPVHPAPREQLIVIVHMPQPFAAIYQSNQTARVPD